MISPSPAHTLCALGVQWGLALVTKAVSGVPLTTTLPITGAFAAGVWLGREFEQIWPHAGIKPLPEGTDGTDWQRFIRQGLYPAVACAVAAIVAGYVW